MGLLTNRYFVALGIPIVLLLAGAIAKKLVRASTWQWKDFYLGVEFTLAAMSSGLVYILDLVKDMSTAQGSQASLVARKLAGTGGFLAVTFFMLLFLLSVHQDWEGKNNQPVAQRLRLGVLSNLIGSGLLAARV